MNGLLWGWQITAAQLVLFDLSNFLLLYLPLFQWKICCLIAEKIFLIYYFQISVLFCK